MRGVLGQAEEAQALAWWRQADPEEGEGFEEVDRAEVSDRLLVLGTLALVMLVDLANRILLWLEEGHKQREEREYWQRMMADPPEGK